MDAAKSAESHLADLMQHIDHFDLGHSIRAT